MLRFPVLSSSTNTDGGRRQGEREAFAQIPDAIAQPNLSHDGVLMRSHTTTEEAAHRLGRALHVVGRHS